MLENSSKSFRNLKAPTSKGKGIDRDHVEIPTSWNTRTYSNRSLDKHITPCLKLRTTEKPWQIDVNSCIHLYTYHWSYYVLIIFCQTYHIQWCQKPLSLRAAYVDFNGKVLDRWPCGSSPIPSPRPCVSCHRASRLVVENGEGNGGTGPCPLDGRFGLFWLLCFFISQTWSQAIFDVNKKQLI